MPVIELPNGEHAEFPDEMSMDEIKSVLLQKFPPKSEEKKISPAINALARGATKVGGMFGYSPEDVARMASNVNQSVQPFMQHPITQGIIGFGDEFTNAPIRAANTGARMISNNSQDLPLNQTGDNSTANQIGKALGGGAAYAAASELAAPLAAGARLAQMQGIPGMVARQGARTLGGAAFEGSQQTDDPLSGAIKGGGVQTAFDLLGRGVPGALKYLDAGKHLEGILQRLGKGKNVEDNAKSFAQDVKNKYENLREEGGNYFQSVFNEAKARGLNDPEAITITPKSYGKIPSYPETFKQFRREDLDPDMLEMHEEFIKNPTIENAHNLQSEIGYEIRRVEKMKELRPSDNAYLKRMNRAQKALINDIEGKLSSTSGNFPVNDVAVNDLLEKTPGSEVIANKNLKQEIQEMPDRDLSQDYRNARKWWKENVVPFHGDKVIKNMAKGEIENPGKIHDIFKNPEEDVLNVLSHLGPEANNKIMFDRFAQRKNLTPESAVKEFIDAKEKGYGEFISPELQNEFRDLSKKAKGKRIAGATIGGLAAMGLAPGSVLGTAAGALLGGKFSEALGKGIPNIEKIATKNVANATKSNSIMDYLKKYNSQDIPSNVTRGTLMQLLRGDN